MWNVVVDGAAGVQLVKRPQHRLISEPILRHFHHEKHCVTLSTTRGTPFCASPSRGTKGDLVGLYQEVSLKDELSRKWKEMVYFLHWHIFTISMSNLIPCGNLSKVAMEVPSVLLSWRMLSDNDHFTPSSNGSVATDTVTWRAAARMATHASMGNVVIRCAEELQDAPEPTTHDLPQPLLGACTCHST